MPGLSEALRAHRLVGLDSMVFIYDMEGVNPYAGLLSDLLDELSIGSLRAVTSALSLTEIMVRPLQMNRLDLATRYDSLLYNHPNLTLLPVDRSIAWRAAQLRARYRIQTVDAVQVATSLAAGATAFVTNDSRLSRVVELQVIQLDDFRA